MTGDSRPEGCDTGRRRVLFVTSSYPRWPGDSTTAFVHHLARDMWQRGWKVEVLAPHAPGAATGEVLDGVPVQRFRYLWPESMETLCYNGGALVRLRRNPWSLAKVPFLVSAEWLAVLQRLRRGEFDLVHSHWIIPQGFSCVLAARWLGIPHVATVHGGDVFALRGRVLSGFKRFTLERASAVTVNSSATAEAVRLLTAGGVTPERIPMGVDDSIEIDEDEVRRLRRRHRSGSGPLLVFVGRLVEEKGPYDLLDAVALLRGSLPGVSVVLVGDGPERPGLERRAAQLGITGCVCFAGWVPAVGVYSYLAAADVFVGPSKRAADGWVEAQGLTFVEAMLAGTPVVSTASGGIADAVRDGETGLITAEGCPEEIASAVQRLCTDPDLADRLRRCARQLALAGFTRQASAGAFAALYEQVLAGTQ